MEAEEPPETRGAAKAAASREYWADVGPEGGGQTTTAHKDMTAEAAAVAAAAAAAAASKEPDPMAKKGQKKKAPNAAAGNNNNQSPQPAQQQQPQGEISIEAALEQAHAIEQQLKAAHQELHSATTAAAVAAAAEELPPLPPPPPPPPPNPTAAAAASAVATAASAARTMQDDNEEEEEEKEERPSGVKQDLEDDEVEDTATDKTPPPLALAQQVAQLGATAAKVVEKATPRASVTEDTGRKGYCHGVLLRKCSCEFPEDCRTMVRHWCEPVGDQKHRDGRRAGYLEIPWFRQYASTEHTLFKNQQRSVYLHHIRSKKKTPLVEGAPNSRARTYVALHHFDPSTLKPDGKGLLETTTENPELIKKLRLKKNLERIVIPGHVQHNTYFVPPNFSWRDLVDAFLQTGGLPCELRQIVPAPSQQQGATMDGMEEPPELAVVAAAAAAIPAPDAKRLSDRRLADGIALRRCECNYPEDCRKLVMHWCQLVLTANGKQQVRRDSRRAGYICLPRPQEKTDTTLRKYKSAKRQVYLRHLTAGSKSPEEHDLAAAKKNTNGAGGGGGVTGTPTGSTSSGGYNPQYIALHHFPPSVLKEDGSGLVNEVVDSRFVDKLTISRDDAVPKNDGWYFVPPCYGWDALRDDYVKTGGNRDNLTFFSQDEGSPRTSSMVTRGSLMGVGGLAAKKSTPGNPKPAMTDSALEALLRRIETDKESFARDYLAMEKQSSEMKEELRGHKSYDDRIQKELVTVRNDLQAAKDVEIMLRAEASKGLTRQNLVSDAWHRRFPEAASIVLGFSDWSEFKFFVSHNFADVAVEGAEGRITDFEKIIMATMRAHRSYDYGIIGLIFGHNRRRIGEWVGKWTDRVKGFLDVEQKKAKSRNACFHLAPSSEEKPSASAVAAATAPTVALPTGTPVQQPLAVAAVETPVVPMVGAAVAVPLKQVPGEAAASPRQASPSAQPKRALPLQQQAGVVDPKPGQPPLKKSRKEEQV